MTHWPPVDERGNLDRRVFALIQHTDRCMGRAPLMEFTRLEPARFKAEYMGGPQPWPEPGAHITHPDGRHQFVPIDDATWERMKSGGYADVVRTHVAASYGDYGLGLPALIAEAERDGEPCYACNDRGCSACTDDDGAPL